MTTRKPAEVFPPGEFLRDELEERGWTQADFAEILGSPVGTVSELITGKRGLTPDMARRLSAALGTSAEFWMNLETAYRLSKASDDEGPAISRRAKLYAKAPIKDMIRRGWLEPSDNIGVMESQVLRFLGIADIDEEPLLPLHAARKSTSYDLPMTSTQVAWLVQAIHLSHSCKVDPYSPERLVSAIQRLKELLTDPQDASQVPRILGEAGVKYVVVQSLPGSKIDGACLWIEGTPVVAMSLRFDRIDNFWFVLFHELEHVRQGASSLDVELDRSVAADLSDTERHANEGAQRNLIPQAKLDEFVARTSATYSSNRIETFAKSLRVHPGIVVGQLQHRGEIPYSAYRKWMLPVRQWVSTSARIDGWNSGSA